MKKKLLYFAFLVVSIASLLVFPSTAMAFSYTGDICEIAEELPEQVTVKIVESYSAGGSAYFQEILVSGDTNIDGTYEGWCFDVNSLIGVGTEYTANVYLSYCDYLPTGIVEIPDNLDLVNYILNQDYVGTAASGCSGDFTYGDVQAAIWQLIDGEIPVSAPDLGDWSPCRVDEIIAAASDGFVPGCGEVVIVLLDPVDGSQPLGIPLPLVCDLEGLTPGFWKNHTDLWQIYDKYDTVGDVFDVNGFSELGDDTLLKALKYKGGKGDIGMARILLQQAVAALLNASHEDVNYPMAVEDIIADVNDALASGDRDTMEELKDILDDYNNLGGGIDAHGNPI